MKRCIRIACIPLALLCIAIMGAVGYWEYCLPDSFYVEQGQTLTVNKTITVSPSETEDAAYRAAGAQVGGSYNATLRWLGVFPIKEVGVTVVDQSVVVLGGIPFGVKLYTDGVLVVSLSSVDTAAGSVYPARAAGLKVGDLILSIDGQTVYTNEEVAALVQKSAGKPMHFRIRRDGIESTLTFGAVKSRGENQYKAGIWVRDSSAGIGTLTFYDPTTNILAGLGHAVCDVDTGDIIPIASGEIVPARIYGVTKSETGSPGELRGGFENGSYGPLIVNGISGVYALCGSGSMVGDTREILLKQEIQTGKAQIYTTVAGTQPEWYDIRITQIRYHDENATRNMVIEITDERLLKKTGGIVQGMSGSPIVQNGKLVGAVTHVLINDPTKGYAIFAENMLETAQQVSSEQLKNAS